jgi:hypothetical protein
MKASIKMHNQNKGYTLLFAVITATLVLGVAVFILSISRGQYLLASTARESTYAIYAADSGIECAAAVAANLSTSTGGTMTCAGETYNILGHDDPNPSLIKFDDTSVTDLSAAFQAVLYIGLEDNRCAKITFNKGFDELNGAGNVVTQIESRGYNYCTDTGGGVWEPSMSNPRVVERAIRLTYTGL